MDRASSRVIDEGTRFAVSTPTTVLLVFISDPPVSRKRGLDADALPVRVLGEEGGFLPVREGHHEFWGRADDRLVSLQGSTPAACLELGKEDDLSDAPRLGPFAGDPLGAGWGLID